jgi:hypothetical protein
MCQRGKLKKYLKKKRPKNFTSTSNYKPSYPRSSMNSKNWNIFKATNREEILKISRRKKICYIKRKKCKQNSNFS